jgi:hypothetical protein
MILDGQLEFSDSQAVTATAVSTNSVDLGPISPNLNVAIGTGENLFIRVANTVAMTDSGSDSTVTVTLETDDNAAFSSPTVVQTIGVFPAVSPAGTIRIARLVAGVDYERYIQLRYTVAGGNLTTGSFDAHMLKDIDAYKNYADNITIS